MRSSAAVAVAAGLALLTGACTHTYACASASAPGGPPSPPPARACPGAPRASTAPPARARLSGSGQSNPVVAVVGQRVVARVRSPGLPLRSIPVAFRPGVLCYVSAVAGPHTATVVFTAWHPGSVLVLAYAGGSGCGAEELIYEVKIVVRSP